MKTPAKGQKGILLRDMFGRVWFRQYNKDYTFIDYDISHYDLEVEITDETAVLIQTEQYNRVDYQ